MSLHARRRAALPLALFLGLFAYAGCGGDSGPVTAESSKFRPAGEGAAPSAEATTGGDETAAPAAPRKVKVQPPRKGASASRPAGEDVPPSPFAEQATDAADQGPGPGGKYAVPDGKDMQTLLRFIDQMGAREPQGTTQEEVLADLVAISEARLLAARRALSGKLNKQTQSAVLSVIQQIYSLLDSNNVPGTRERMTEFADELAGSSDPELAERGRLQGFGIRISGMIESKPENADEIVSEVKQLVADEKESIGAFVVAIQIASVLQQMAQQTPGLRPGVAELLTFLGTTYKEHPEEQVAQQAAQLLDGSRLVTIDLGGKYQALKDGAADAEEKLRAAVDEVFAQQPSVAVLQEMQDLAYRLEAEAANYELAQFVYDALEKGFAQHEDEQLKEAAASIAGSAKQRIGLIGKPLVVEGVLLNGQPFNWSELAGKVVLVDFWATWCGPCLAEFPNIAENYEAYQKKGFEVVGVSVDKDMADLERFFSRQDIPWLVVVSQELYEKKSIESQGRIAHPLAEACGIDAIPFVVLVGKDGNVDSIHVRGEKLHTRLKELLGEPAAADGSKGEKKGNDEGADDAKPKQPEPEAAEKSDDASGCGAEPAEEQAADAPAEEESTVNPYLAKPGLSTADLVKYIEKMLDKPKTIQARNGFAEALCDACDRVLQADPPADEAAALLAAETKLETLHKAACDGDAQADERLAAFCEQLAGDARPKISQRVAFYALEREVLAADQVPPEQIDAVLKEVADYCGQQPLDGRHLRLASSTVALINRIEDGEAREKHFVSFGNLFAKASDKELARYGKKLAKKPAATESDLVGKELELSGTLASGAPFDWKKYRGKVVLVDFWATWCGPCLREMPLVRELHEKLHEQGLEVVGISLDKDPEALARFLGENEVPWETLAGDETQGLAEKYGVRGIPTMLAVDKDGKILGVAHQVAALRPILEKALEK